MEPFETHDPRAVATTWQTSVNELSAPGRRLLERLAWLAPEPVPNFLIEVPVPGIGALIGFVKGTPGVTGFVGASNEPVPLTQAEVDRLLHQETAERPRSRAQFSIGESVKVISGPLSDFSGEIAEINEDGAKLKVLVSIFGRETPVEVGYDQVKKI